MRGVIRLVVVLAAVGAAGWYGWRWVFPDDTAAIRAVLDRIEDGVGAGRGDGGNVNRLARAASLRNEFAADVTVEAGPPFQRLTGREEIIGAAASVSASTRGLQVRFEDVEVAIEPGRQRAEVTLTAEVRTTGAEGGFDARELHVVFTRLDGRWVVAHVTLIRALQPMENR